mmetsp:Transcript_39591/g.84562  ORF Transcript_39591/g.84562 Transcript_39591/m.84562 type:complete len:225 (-) Transcript_39591:298-972(-)
MDDHDARHAELAELAQGQAHGQRARRVQARCWFVQEQQSGLGRKLETDVDALALTSADSSVLDASHDAVLDVVNLHHVQDVLGDEFDSPLGQIRAPAQAHGELDLLSNGQVLVHDVVLRHEAHEALQLLGICDLVVDSHSSDHVAVGSFATKNIHECRFASAGWPHNGAHSSSLKFACYPVQHALARLQIHAQILKFHTGSGLFGPHAAELVFGDFERRHEVSH